MDFKSPHTPGNFEAAGGGAAAAAGTTKWTAKKEMSSCCPGHRCKNTGSGYVKDSSSSPQTQSLNKQMNDLIAARAAQEAAIWAPVAPKQVAPVFMPSKPDPKK